MKGNPEKWIQIHLSRFVLDFVERDWSVLTYPIGIGLEETPTPTGVYFIFSMIRNPRKMFARDTKYPAQAYGTRCMNLSVQAFDRDARCWRHYAIHGTDDESLIPGRCSHGCVRMRNPDIEQLYERCEPGMLVSIV